MDSPLSRNVNNKKNVFLKWYEKNWKWFQWLFDIENWLWRSNLTLVDPKTFFFRVIWKIFPVCWTAKHLAQASCTELTLLLDLKLHNHYCYSLHATILMKLIILPLGAFFSCSWCQLVGKWWLRSCLTSLGVFSC